MKIKIKSHGGRQRHILHENAMPVVSPFLANNDSRMWGAYPANAMLLDLVDTCGIALDCNDRWSSSTRENGVKEYIFRQMEGRERETARI